MRINTNCIVSVGGNALHWSQCWRMHVFRTGVVVVVRTRTSSLPPPERPRLWARSYQNWTGLTTPPNTHNYFCCCCCFNVAPTLFSFFLFSVFFFLWHETKQWGLLDAERQTGRGKTRRIKNSAAFKFSKRRKQRGRWGGVEGLEWGWGGGGMKVEQQRTLVWFVILNWNKNCLCGLIVFCFCFLFSPRIKAVFVYFCFWLVCLFLDGSIFLSLNLTFDFWSQSQAWWNSYYQCNSIFLLLHIAASDTVHVR